MADENKFAKLTDQMIREERDSVAGKMKEIRDEADKSAEKRFTSEQEQTWDELNARYDDLGEELTAREKDRQQRSRLDEIEEQREAATNGRKTGHEPIGGDGARAGGEAAEIRSAAYRKWLAGDGGFSAAECRALQADSDTVGGSLYADEQFQNTLIKFVDDQVFIRGLATVNMIANAKSAVYPSWDTDPDDPVWTAEVATGDEDSAARSGNRKMTPHPLAKRIKVSRTLIRNVPNADDFVAARLAYKFATTEENAFLTGSGQNEPLGLFTASSNGISTNRDVSTDLTSTNVTGDGLIEVKYSLKSQYMNSPTTRWLWHRDGIKRIRKLKLGDGQYIWSPGLGGTPGTILDIPYVMSEFAPNTFTTGQYVGLLGDLKFYWILEAMGMEMQRLMELYAETNQIGIIGRRELDGMPVLEEAFARVKLA